MAMASQLSAGLSSGSVILGLWTAGALCPAVSAPWYAEAAR